MVHQETTQRIPLLTPYKMRQFDLSYRNVLQPQAAVFYLQRAPRASSSSQRPRMSPPPHRATRRPPASGRSNLQPDGQAPISSTDKQLAPNSENGMVYSKPRRLRTDEIPQIVDDFRRTAWNAIEAGFDGVECHMVEPRMFVVDGRRQIPHELLSFRNWEEGNKVAAEGYTDLVAYGRLFLANPDLPRRFELDAPLNKYDCCTFYTQDPIVGYTDYPFLDDHNDSAAHA